MDGPEHSEYDPAELPCSLTGDFALALQRTTRCPDISEALSGPRMRRYAALLHHWSAKMNLVSPRDRDCLATRHLVPALCARSLLLALPHVHIADLGSGAGLPGIPLAISLPDSHFSLIESRRRRVTFLRHAVRVLRLSNVHIVHARLEQWHPANPIDCLVTRAVTSQPDGLRVAMRILAPHGALLHYASASQAIKPAATYLWSQQPDLPGGRLRIIARVSADRT